MEEEKDGKKIINIDLDDSDTNDSNSENSTLQSEGIGSGTNRKHKRTNKAFTDVLRNNMKFLNNFDPEHSNREKRKLTRKFYADAGKKTIYDENGILCVNGAIEKDICDCLDEECPGCHFPCPKCRSCKCGIDCRVNRKWMFEAIENEGETTMTKNTYSNLGAQSTASG